MTATGVMVAARNFQSPILAHWPGQSTVVRVREELRHATERGLLAQAQESTYRP